MHRGTVTGIKNISALPYHDLAILEVEGYTGPVLKLSRSSNDIHQDYTMLDTLFLLSSTKIFKTSFIDSFIDTIPTNFKVAVQKNTNMAGSSGGPVLNSQGIVLGIVSSGNELLVDVVGSGTIRHFLKKPSVTNPFIKWEEGESYITEQIKHLHNKIAQGNVVSLYVFSRLIKYENEKLYLLSLYQCAKLGYPPAEYDWFVTLLDKSSWDENKQLKNPEAVVSWLQSSAHKGDINAQNDMGIMFYNGWLGRKKDVKAAVQWFLKAAAQGSELALIRLANIILSGESMSEKHQKATGKLLKYFAQKGHVESQYHLGRMYYKGIVFEKNRHKALNLLHSAARWGHPKAQVYFGSLLYNGEAGFVRSPEAALPYFTQAARQDEEFAQKILKDHYGK